MEAFEKKITASTSLSQTVVGVPPVGRLIFQVDRKQFTSQVQILVSNKFILLMVATIVVLCPRLFLTKKKTQFTYFYSTLFFQNRLDVSVSEKLNIKFQKVIGF